MDAFLLNFLDIDGTSLQVMALMCLAGIFLMQQTTERTASSLLFFPVLLLCALAIRSVAIPLGIMWGMEEGEFVVLTTTFGMCIGLAFFAMYSRATSTVP